jgi:hypothetical protein
MRTEEINVPVPEESNPPFKVVFRDSNGAVATPLSLTWDLTTLDGTVLAVRQDATVLGATSYIIPTTAQIRILEGESVKGERLLTLHATYTHSTGAVLTTRKQIKFSIQDLKLVGYPLSIDVSETIFTDDYPRDVVVE